MRYAFHFELCERPELPEWLRSDVFRSLAFIQERFGMSRVLGREVPPVLRALGARRVIELGAGSGDGLAQVAAGLAKSEGPAVPLLATDKFPQPEAWAEKLGAVPGAGWSTRSVGFEDFDQVLSPELLRGSVLLLVSAFHHLPPDRARRFLERASRAGAHVLVVEPLSRTLGGVLMGLGAGLAGLLFPLLALLGGSAGVGWFRQALGHWLLPLVPFILSHDGVVSALRQRTPEEWQALVAELPFELQPAESYGALGNFSTRLLRCQ